MTLEKCLNRGGSESAAGRDVVSAHCRPSTNARRFHLIEFSDTSFTRKSFLDMSRQETISSRDFFSHTHPLCQVCTAASAWASTSGCALSGQHFGVETAGYHRAAFQIARVTSCPFPRPRYPEAGSPSQSAVGGSMGAWARSKSSLVNRSQR